MERKCQQAGIRNQDRCIGRHRDSQCSTLRSCQIGVSAITHILDVSYSPVLACAVKTVSPPFQIIAMAHLVQQFSVVVYKD
jgi:hypothetical protein